MKRSILAALALVALAATAYAGNVHKDGNSTPLQFFAPIKGTSITHTKADQTYTPTAGTKLVRFRSDAAISYKINGTGTAFPIAANTNEGPFGIATRSGVGTAVTSIVFTGISSATKTVYIQEQ